MKATRIIQASRSPDFVLYFRECWERRSLIMMLMWRDIRVRYVQTYLGMLWALLNPLISLLLLLFVFNVIGKTDHDGIPSVVFITSGLCVWSFFAKIVSESGASLISAQSLIKKVYFPRLVIPFSKTMGALAEFAIALVILFLLLLIYHIPLSLRLVWIIPGMFVLILISLGCGIWVAALNIRYRDFHHLIPVLLRIGMFATPVAYGTRLVPEQYKWIVSFNPLTGLLDGFRWILFGLPVDISVVLTSIAFGLLLLATGMWYFISMERYIADII